VPTLLPEPARRLEETDALTLLAALVAGEARGEPHLGKLAVAWVVRNRVEANDVARYGRGWHGVMLKPYQFACFNAVDPNRLKLLRPEVHFGAEVWRDCYAAAAAAFFELSEDPTDGANHYHAVYEQPYWADPEKQTTVIVRHVFYKL